MAKRPHDDDATTPYSIRRTYDGNCCNSSTESGVAHPVPGGLAPRQVLSFLQNAGWRLVIKGKYWAAFGHIAVEADLK